MTVDCIAVCIRCCNSDCNVTALCDSYEGGSMVIISDYFKKILTTLATTKAASQSWRPVETPFLSNAT